MAVYRTGYSTGTYGVRAFGVDGAVTDAISLAEVSSTNVVSAEVVRDATASTSATTLLTSDSVYVVDALATASIASANTAAGEVIYLGGATVSAGVTSATASLQFLTNAEANDSVTATVSSSGVRVGESGANVLPAATATCDGFGTLAGVSAASSVSSFTSSGLRVRESSGIITGTNTFTASGLYKYEPVAKDNEAWAVVPQGNEIWTEVA